MPTYTTNSKPATGKSKGTNWVYQKYIKLPVINPIREYIHRMGCIAFKRNNIWFQNLQFFSFTGIWEYRHYSDAPHFNWDRKVISTMCMVAVCGALWSIVASRLWREMQYQYRDRILPFERVKCWDLWPNNIYQLWVIFLPTQVYPSLFAIQTLIVHCPLSTVQSPSRVATLLFLSPSFSFVGHLL